MPEEPAAKRQRVSDFVLQPEDEFMAAHSGTSKIMVQVTARHCSVLLTALLCSRVSSYKAVSRVLYVVGNRKHPASQIIG